MQRRTTKTTQGVCVACLCFMSLFLYDLFKDNMKRIKMTEVILESFSMTFRADGKRKIIPLFFYSFHVILK